MKKTSLLLLGAVMILASCTRVEPNNYGVLMKNFGKKGKDDYTLVAGRVNTIGASKKLFEIPAWEQRAAFDKEMPMHLEAADKTAFTSTPSYSYVIRRDRAIDVVFNNAQLGSGDGFMKALENNVLETRIYDITKDISRKYTTDTLMAVGGNMKFENEIRSLVKLAFDSIGVDLRTFTCPLVPSQSVANRIDKRNEVNTNVSVLDQSIIEQRKKNELAVLEREYNKILSEGLTQPILMDKFIQKWDGKTPIYGTLPGLVKTVQ